MVYVSYGIFFSSNCFARHAADDRSQTFIEHFVHARHRAKRFQSGCSHVIIERVVGAVADTPFTDEGAERGSIFLAFFAPQHHP